MSHRPRPTTFRHALVVLSLILSTYSRAQMQVTVNPEDCSGADTPCTRIVNQQETNFAQLEIEGAPPSGPGQVALVSTRGGVMFGLQDEATVVKSEPYQAQAVTEMKQTLADGSHIDQTTTANVARDSDGRTVRIQKLTTIGPWRSSGSSQGDSQTLTTIFDPVSKEHIDFTSDTKVAHVVTMPSLPPLTPPGPAGAEGAFAMAYAGSAAGAGEAVTVQARTAIPLRTVAPLANNGAQPKTESLGTRTIEGIQATGTRTTKTIPAGTIGNDKDLIITHETWFSPELKLVIQSTQDDPRFGQTTYTLKNIQQGQPDETLFQIPADYKVNKIVPRLAPPQ
jgi:hypothetical protein